MEANFEELIMAQRLWNSRQGSFSDKLSMISASGD
jgi:hypothetical protein